jgi:hypothetical protein
MCCHESSPPLTTTNKARGIAPLHLQIGGVLVASGLFHLFLLWLSGGEWDGAVSLRKPALFGISAGVTVWSLAWVVSQLVPRRHDERIAVLMSVSLLLEVVLITLQQWRCVPSHFNRSTMLDASIEAVMLGFILFVTAGIAWLCCRTRELLPMPMDRKIAMRAGIWLLLISCFLGILVTIGGEVNRAVGRSPEVWGRAGVLKYPHGAVLHAIQTLLLLSWLLRKLKVRNAAWLVRSAVAAHVVFLAQAIWQTAAGRGRLDVDTISFIGLVTTTILLSFPVIAILLQTRELAKVYMYATKSPPSAVQLQEKV